MKNSAYLQKQNELHNKLINLGKEHGEQYCMDCVMIALHRQGWGYTRIKRLFDDVTEISDYYAPCMQRDNPEQPIFQERMDSEIRSFVEGQQEFYPFKDRYPLITEARYDKPLKQKG